MRTFDQVEVCGEVPTPDFQMPTFGNEPISASFAACSNPAVEFLFGTVYLS